MSASLTNAVWTHSHQSGSYLTVLLALAWWAEDDGSTQRSIQEIADRVNLKVRTVQDILGKLSDAHSMEIIVHPGRGNKNTYLLTPDQEKVQKTAPIIGKGAEEFVNYSAEKVRNSARKGAVDRTPYHISIPVIPVDVVSSNEKVQKTAPITKVISPELRQTLDLWKSEGLGPVSLNAQSGLRSLIAEHGVDLVLDGVRRASAQSVKWPISWLKVVIPSLKRERSQNSATNRRNESTPQVPGDQEGWRSAQERAQTIYVDTDDPDSYDDPEQKRQAIARRNQPA